jgi:hypothetical protein
MFAIIIPSTFQKFEVEDTKTYSSLEMFVPRRMKSASNLDTYKLSNNVK